MGLDKNLIDARSSMVKKYNFLFLSTVPLACMGQIENSVAPCHHRKNIYLRFCLKYYFMGLTINSIDTQPPPKKN